MGFHIVGTRHDGSQLVLESCKTRDRAKKLRRGFADVLRGYSKIVVEREKPANKTWDRRGSKG